MKRWGVVIGLLAGLGLVGCSGGGNGSGSDEKGVTGTENEGLVDESPEIEASPPEATEVGVFRDGTVVNYRYISCDSTRATCVKGNGNQNGEFKYYDGGNTQFFVGDYLLGEGTSQKLVTPAELTSEDGEVNMASFLMTIDDDDNPENGIYIDNSTHALFSISGEPVSMNFEDRNEVIESSEVTGKTLVTQADASEHLQKTNTLRHLFESENRLARAYLGDMAYGDPKINLEAFNNSPLARLKYEIFLELSKSLLDTEEQKQKLNSVERRQELVDTVTGFIERVIETALSLYDISQLPSDVGALEFALTNVKFIDKGASAGVLMVIEATQAAAGVSSSQEVYVDFDENPYVSAYFTVLSALSMDLIAVADNSYSTYENITGSTANDVQVEARKHTVKFLGTLWGAVSESIISKGVGLTFTFNGGKAILTKGIGGVVGKLTFIQQALDGARIISLFFNSLDVQVSEAMPQAKFIAFLYLSDYFASAENKIWFESKMGSSIDFHEAIPNLIDSNIGTYDDIYIGKSILTKLTMQAFEVATLKYNRITDYVVRNFVEVESKILISQYISLVNHIANDFVMDVGASAGEGYLESLSSTVEYFCVGDSDLVSLPQESVSFDYELTTSDGISLNKISTDEVYELNFIRPGIETSNLDKIFLFNGSKLSGHKSYIVVDCFEGIDDEAITVERNRSSLNIKVNDSTDRIFVGWVDATGEVVGTDTEIQITINELFQTLGYGISPKWIERKIYSVEAKDSAIYIEWKNDDPALLYNIYYSTESFKNITDPENLTINGASLVSGVSGRNYTITNLENETLYYIVITSMSDSGEESAPSNEVSGTPKQQIVIDGTSKLNDTGITLCGNYDAENEGQWSSTLNCADTGATQTSSGTDQYGNTVPAGQDAHYGRDALAASGQLIKIGGGSAGFDFTKLDASGNDLPETATAWSCVRDNVTGLIWEVKDPSNGIVGDSLHDGDDRYNWYSTASSTNGGSVGFADNHGAICYGYDSSDSSTYCNTEAFVNRVNAAGLCGANDWRMPKKEELRSIVHYGRVSPSIDTDYFPNTANNRYWLGSPTAKGSLSSWFVDFNYGGIGKDGRYGNSRVRLVRSVPRSTID